MVLPRILVVAFIAAFPLLAFALDDSDEGTYAVVHVDGHITQKHIQLSRHGNEWIALDSSASPPPNACPSCLLKTSTQADVERFLGGSAPAGMSAECVHNALMAICRITETHGTEVTRQYGFIALGQGKPAYLKLTRLNGTK